MKSNQKGVCSRLISFLIVILTLLSMCTVGFVGVSAADSDLASTGASAKTVTIDTGASVTISDKDGDNFYEIYTADELYAFSKIVSNGSYSINGILMNDIVFNPGVVTESTSNPRVWLPIGNTSSKFFTGTLDGNYKSVSGLYVTATTSSYKSFVGCSSGTVKNVTVKNSFFKSDNSCAGVVARNRGTVSNCASINNILQKGGEGLYYGGIVGYNQGKVINCISNCTINSKDQTGGIIGRNCSGGSVSNCLSLSTINTTSTSNVGGVVGYLESTSVSNCYYLDTTHTGGMDSKDTAGKAEGVTAEQLSSGEAAYLLQGSQSSLAWVQDIVYDDVPRLVDGSGNADEKVYYGYLTCASDNDTIGYTNRETSASAKPAHNYTPATCTTAETCTYCGEVKSAALGHSYVETVTEVSCVNDGFTTHKCSVCSDTYVDNMIAAWGHDYTSVTVEPTRTSEGYTTHTCETCGDTYTDNIVSPLGANVGGDYELIDKIDTTTPYIETVSSSYAIDTPILVKADNGTRLALYASSVTAPTSSDKAIYTFNLSGYEGETVDLRTGTYNSSSGYQSYLKEGTYNLFLFTDSGYTVGAKTSIKIINGNINTIDGTTTYLETNRKVYRYGEPILIKAKAGNNANAWLGVYESTADYKEKAPEYIIYIGSGYSGNKGGTSNVDLIANSVVNKNMELKAKSPNDYKVYLFSDKNPITATVLGELTIKIRYGVSNANRSTFGYGEDIITNVEEYSTSDVSISNQLVVAGSASGTYEASSTTPNVSITNKTNLIRSYFYTGATTANGSPTTFIVSGDKVTLLQTSGGNTYNRLNAKFSSNYANHWYWPNFNPTSDSDVKIYGTLTAPAYLYSTAGNSAPTTSTAKVVDYQFPAGTPYNYIEYYNILYSKVQIGTYVGYLYHNRWSNSYINQQFEFHPAATTFTADRNAGFHTYTDGVSPSASTLVTSYKLTSYPRATVVLQDVADMVIEPDVYKMYLMRNASYNSYTNKTITVKDYVTGKFGAGAYQVENLTDGFANGKVALEIDAPSTYGYVGNADTYAVVYWAGADQKPLAGYSSFYRTPLEKDLITFDMPKYTVIPEGATGLVAYVQFKDVQGETGYYIPLPDGCSTYTSLDEGVLAEFQVLADTKLGPTSDSALTQYPNNNTHYQTALEDIAKNSPDSQFVFINGDVTHGNTSAQWALVNSLRTEAANSANASVPPVYVSHGNTDGSGSLSAFSGYINYVNNQDIGSEVSEDKLYYSFYKNGYKYIVLCCDVVNQGEEASGDANKIKNILSAAQLEWLDQELAENKQNNDGKPVFLFYHFALKNTTIDSNMTDRLVNTDELSAVLKKYDNVYSFHGNHRLNLASDNSIFGGSETLPIAINASSTAGTLYRTNGTTLNYDSDSHKTCNENSAQGLYVRVYADKVVILGRDFNTGTWVPEACCVLQNNDVSLADDLVTVQYGETRSNNYVVNPEKRKLSGAMSNDTSLVTVSNDGKITASNSKQGATTVNVSVMPSNTRVLKRLETDVRVVDVMGNNHYLVGSFNNWGEGYRMNIVNEDVDVLSHSLELLPGTYEFRIDSFDKELGADIVINDSTTEELTLANNSGNITLVATGGNYTFTYNKATKKLTVDCKPFTQDDTDANDLFARAERKNPYLDMSKEVYTFGEPLYATTQGGKWIGIFKADADITTANSAYLIDTTGKDAKVFDLKTGLINLNDGNLDPGRTPGSYKAVLFGTDDKSQVLDTEYFDVVNGNNFHYNANNMISSNQKVYSYGQEIYVSAYTDRPDLKPWVAVVEHGAKVNDDTLKYWYYLPIVGAGDDAYVDSSNQNLIHASDINNGIFLEPGKYDIYLYRTSSYSSPRGFVTIEVSESPVTTSLSGIVTTDKDVYSLGEDIITTVYTGNTNSWVGIYKGDYSAADPADATQHIAWYKTFNNDGFSSVLQRMDECSTFNGELLTADEATPGTYTAILFKDVAQYDTILSKHVFTIDDSVKGKVLQGAYKVDSLTDGFANGRVAVELDESAYNYINSGSITLYWADAQGKPLADYMPFGEETIKNTITVFDLDPYVFIPEEAAGFVAYISYNGTESEYGRFIKLPDNCQTYTGLDTGVKSEFQIVADLQLGTDIGYDTQQNVEALFTDVANNSAGSTGVFVSGDATYLGLDSEFALIDSIKASVEASTGKTLPSVYISYGDSDGQETFVNYVNSHGGNVTVDKKYYSLTVDGYKYIFMAVDGENNTVSAAQLEWLDAELKANEENGGKPVFVLLHNVLSDTVYTPHNPISNTEEVTAITRNYNDVYIFSGHAMISLDSELEHVYGGTEEKPVVINASTAGFGRYFKNGVRSEATDDYSHGYYVRTYEDKIVLLGRDFLTGKWIPDACYVLYNDDIQVPESVDIVVEETLHRDDYIINPKGRELVFTTSDAEVASVDEVGNIFGANPGEAEVTIFAYASNTEVIALNKVTVIVGGEGYPSKYSVNHLGDWDNGTTLIYTADRDIVKATVELEPGSYMYAVRKGDNYYGATASVNDKTNESIVLDNQDFINLIATGGYYTFTYSISKNMLDIEFEPLDFTETGSKTATIYVDYEDSDFTSTPYIYIWDENKESVNKNIGPFAPGQLLSGPNSEGYYYRTFKYDTSYQFVISDGENVKTADSIVYDQEEVYVYFTEGTDYVTEKDPWFWIDLTPNDPSDPVDRLYPELVGMDGNYPLYCFYLPAGVDAKKLRLYGDEGANMKVSFVPVTVDGTKTVNLSGGVNKATKYNITDASNKTIGKLTVKQTAELPAMYINADMMMPIGLGYEAAHKNGYSTAGTIKMVDGTANVLYNDLEFTDLSIKAGDTPSTDVLGKYSYNLTLKDDTALTAGGKKTYELVSYDADEARLRNMTVIELANALGLEDAVSCQPVEVYNNGVYMGSYLLIERNTKSDTTLTLEFTSADTNSFTSLMGQPISCITPDVTADQMTELETKWAEAEAVIYDPAATYEELSSVIDVESFAKVFLLQELSKGINAGADNYYVYYENGKFTAAFKPEYDNTLGQMLPAELTDPEGWWAKTKEIAGEGIPNAQAALCQNPVFWNCVKAEWIEVFYDAASSMVPTEATYNTTTKKVTGQSGTYAEYYTLMAKSAAMDDVKWGICTNDALVTEHVNDSGDIYEISFAFLNNFVYNRLNWMDSELGQGYTLAQPTLSTKKPLYAVNEEIELKAEISSSGTLKYELYNSKGELVYEETTNKGYVTYKTSFSDEIVETFKVVISSERAESPVEAETTVTVEYFDFILEVDAPKKVVGGTFIELKSSTNVEAPVEYTLTDKEGNFLNSSDDGLFEIVTSTDDEAGLLEYIVKAETTVDGITYTTSKNVVVEVIRFELSVDLKGPEKVEAGLDINLIAKAQANDDVAIKYTFYNAEDLTLLGSNYTGAYIFSTDGLEAGALIKFYVVAECEAFGNVYTAKSEVLTVEVESITDIYNVTVYFKSTSTYGYRPLITTEGAVKDVENAEMQKDIFICKNETETASYFWYKAEFSVSKKSPTAFIRILSSRYAMEVQTNMLINEDTVYYFATDNLNDGTVLYDLTYASEDERNWCQSAVHMVYDPKVDSEESLAQVSARVDLRLVGDTTADGKVNIRDATYIQKGLANLITFSKTDLEVADVDDDLKVSIKDATHIQKKLAGIIKNSYDIGGNLNETH